jgi:uncharacterized protein
MKQQIEEEIRRLVHSMTSAAAIEEWKSSSENQKKPLYDYRGDHIEQVVHLAKYLATESNADLEVVTLAAWFHDLAKPGLGGTSIKNHGIASAEIARKWLTEKEYDTAAISRICQAIEQHVGLTLKKPLGSIEAQVLWEADKIHKLGLIGLLQYILNGIRIEPGNSLGDFHTRIVEFLPLAEKIAASAVTEKGKALANRRLQTLKELAKMLEEELNSETEGYT